MGIGMKRFRKSNKVHFLLSAEARELTLEVLYAKLSNEDVSRIFHLIRWPETHGAPCCPHCDETECVVTVPKRALLYRCKKCERMFSLTSGTFLHASKLSLRTILAALLLLADAVKGMSASQFSRQVGIQYKTAFVLMHKIRASLLVENSRTLLDGDVQIDGAYLDTKERKPNEHKAAREQAAREKAAREKAARERAAQGAQTEQDDEEPEWKPTPRCILVARKVSSERGKGGMKTVIGFAPCENGVDVDAFVAKHIATGATVTSDEHQAYAMLVTHFDLKRVNHSERYSGPDGENINQAESYFSRFRRMQIGQNHFFGKHLLAYAAESAWRDDNRRNSNSVNARALLGLLLKPNSDGLWRGFWKVYLRKGKGVTLPAGTGDSTLASAA